MTTQEQRARAKIAARARHSFHVGAGHPDNQIANDVDGEQLHYRGLLGEIVFADSFGFDVDDQLRSGGDDGFDFVLHHGGFVYSIDVKTTSYRGADALLKVPCAHLDVATIYVAAQYDTGRDTAILAGWHWGLTLQRLNRRESFSRRGTLNYVCPLRACRPMVELAAKFVVESELQEARDGA